MQNCDDTPYVGKAKTKFCLRFNSYKSKHRSFRKGKQNVLQKRATETLWQHKLKTFYPLFLNEKKEYLF